MGQFAGIQGIRFISEIYCKDMKGRMREKGTTCHLALSAHSKTKPCAESSLAITCCSHGTLYHVTHLAGAPACRSLRGAPWRRRAPASGPSACQVDELCPGWPRARPPRPQCHLQAWCPPAGMRFNWIQCACDVYTHDFRWEQKALGLPVFLMLSSLHLAHEG